MGKKFNIELALKGVDEGAGSLIEKTALKLKLLRKESALSGEKGLENLLNKGPAGIAEGLGELVGIQKLGIASVVMEQLAGGVEKVTEALKGIKEGKKSWGELFTEDLPRSVPIVGQLYGAVRDFMSELDGSAEETAMKVKEMDRDTQKATAAAQDMVAVWKELRDIDTDLRKEGRDLGHVGESATDKKIRMEQQRYEDQQKALEEERKRIIRSALTESEKQDAQKKLEGYDQTDVFVTEGQETGRNTYHVQGQKEKAEQLHIQAMEDLRQEAFNAQMALAQKNGEDLEKLLADHGAQQLEQQGRTLDAEIMRIRQAGAEKKQALDKQLQDAKKAGTDSLALEINIGAQRAVINGDVDQQIADAQKKQLEADDQVQRDQWDALMAKKGKNAGGGRPEAFRAELLSSRFQGVGRGRDPVADNTAKSASLLEQLVGIAKDGRAGSKGDSPRAMGLPLRA